MRSNLPEVIQVVNGRARIPAKMGLILKALLLVHHVTMPLY